MTRLYVQWGVILGAAAIVVAAAARYYERELTTVTPEAVLDGAVRGDAIRVQGQVVAGTLSGDLEAGQASFQLKGERADLPVRYAGPSPENLRELKTLVIIGQWDSETGVFLARDLALVTNYGFVIGAYLVGFLPLAVFVFTMERRVRLLYAEIKHTKLYEPESTLHVDAR